MYSNEVSSADHKPFTDIQPALLKMAVINIPAVSTLWQSRTLIYCNL